MEPDINDPTPGPFHKEDRSKDFLVAGEAKRQRWSLAGLSESRSGASVGDLDAIIERNHAHDGVGQKFDLYVVPRVGHCAP